MILHIERRVAKIGSTIVFSIWIAACSFKFELTSQKTALENQIMGNYKELEDDLLVTNFERSTTDSPTKSIEKSVASVSLLRAQKNREFNSDDIKELKDNAIIGEMSDGQLSILPKAIGGVSSASPEQLKLAEALIDEENRDRSVIWKMTIPDTEKASDKDDSPTRAVFARELFEKSPSGHWFYVGNRWTVKQ